MNRTLSFERVYNLGNYSTARFGDTIVDIPEELAVNDEVIKTLRMLQIIETEKAFFTYLKKKDVIHAHSVEDALALLEEADQQIIRNINDILNPKNTENNEEK